MNRTDFKHDQWYRMTFDDNQEETGISHYFQAHLYDLPDLPVEDPSLIDGRLLTIEYADFFEDLTQFGLETIVKAEPLTERELVLELLAIIQQDHNQYIEENTGLTCTGQPPVVLRVKPNGWICLDAASFFNRDLKCFGVIATAIEANYELLQSEVLVAESGRRGVCLEIELHGGQ